MNNLKSFFLIAFTLISANAAFAQSRVNGKVVEIVDGKTVIIQMQNRSRIVAELQYIEVPETGQPLNQVAVEHLRGLVLDKVIEFRARGLRQTTTIGQLFLKDVDISQQMIRDGAAWYAVLEKSGQDAAESEIYESNEMQAKSEKRGIWAIDNLKPSWEIRAEAEENRRRAEKAAQETVARMTSEVAAKPVKTVKPKARPQMSSESQMWAATPDTNGKMPENITNVGGLMVGYNAQTKIGIVASPLLKLEIPAGNVFDSFGIGIAYLYHDDEQKGRENIYLVGVESDSKEFRFLKFNDLTIMADNQKIVVGKAKRGSRQNGLLVKETLIYQVKRSVLTKIANAKSVTVKVGTYSTVVNSDVQMMLINFLKVAE